MDTKLKVLLTFVRGRIHARLASVGRSIQEGEGTDELGENVLELYGERNGLEYALQLLDKGLKKAGL